MREVISQRQHSIRHEEKQTGQRPLREIIPSVLHNCQCYPGDTVGSTEKPETAIEGGRCFQTAIEADMGGQKRNLLVPRKLSFSNNSNIFNDIPTNIQML